MSASSEPDARGLLAASERDVVAWLFASLEQLEREAELPQLSPSALGSLLSPPVLRDAIVTTAAVRHELEVAREVIRGRGPIGRVGMIAPSNVETACVRPLVWALLARDAVALRPSSRHAGVAPRFVEILRERSPSLAAAVALAPSRRDDVEAHRALASWADVVHAWGSDGTIALLSTRIERPIVRHGTGLSLVVLSREASARLDGSTAIEGLALDLARYDQRGCLSPHAVLVEEGGAVATHELARALDAALTELESRWPRGALLPSERAAERSWRDTAHATALAVHVGAAHAVSVEASALRDCPGARNVALHTITRERLVALAARLGDQLKSVGVIDGEDVLAVERWLGASASVVPLGAMQRPSLLAWSDGVPPWSGFVRAGDHGTASPLRA